MNILDNIADVKIDVMDIKPDGSSPAVDAIIHVSISNDQLEAYINIEPPTGGGAAPTLAMLKTALDKYDISYNINMAKLKELEAEPVYNRNIVVAGGVAPVNGVDGTVSFRINTEKKSLKPKENEKGVVDFRDLDIVENVKQGQELCVITPPTEGTPGTSVQGRELPQKKGAAVPSYAGKNTELNEDGTAILAQIDGPVEFDGRKISVNEIFYIRGDIDSSTGNIRVASSLSVLGMVLPGFAVEAGKNIEVKGTVENASVKAGGNIKLQSGITGSKLYCEGDLQCRFIENCDVFVKGDITAEYTLNSNIKCGKSLKTVGRRAKIIGGSCVVGQDIVTSTIGSTANVKTRLELGTDYTVIERQQELLAKVPVAEKKIESLKPLITLLQQLEIGNRLTPEKKEMLATAEYNYDTNMKFVEEAKKELAEIAQSINIKGYGQIICSGAIHPGTFIVMGTENLVITETLTNALIYYNEGCICKGSAS